MVHCKSAVCTQTRLGPKLHSRACVVCWVLHVHLAVKPSVVQVRRLRLPDVRNMYGSTSGLNRVYGYERQRLTATLREMLFRNAPSARR